MIKIIRWTTTVKQAKPKITTITASEDFDDIQSLDIDNLEDGFIEDIFVSLQSDADESSPEITEKLDTLKIDPFIPNLESFVCDDLAGDGEYSSR